MRIDAEELLQRIDIINVVEKYLPLKRTGAEYLGQCPWHTDDKASLKVNQSKQIYNCFVCDKGGDAIDFLRNMGRTFHEACAELNGGVMPDASPEQTVFKNREPLVKVAQWKYIAPEHVAPTFEHWRNKASAYWAYRDLTGKVVGFVVRFDLPDGEKEVLPYSYAECTAEGWEFEWKGEGKGKFFKPGDKMWRWLGIPKPRPLYNLHLIHENPKASILVVEGEKTADAVQAQLDPKKTVVTCWIGGANGVERTDWDVLQGRRNILWPDHDTLQHHGDKHPRAGELKYWFEQSGNEAMLAIADRIKAFSAVLKWVMVPADKPHKWDGADEQWQPGELREFVLKHHCDVPDRDGPIPPSVPGPDEPTPPEDPAPKNPELPVIKNPPIPPVNNITYSQETQFQNDCFRTLGYDKDENGKLVYSFFSFDAQAVVKLSPSSMTGPNLLMLAPLNYWEGRFPGKPKFDVTAAQMSLIGNSHARGIFKDAYIRGRGAWMDDGQMIVHTGNRLIIDNKGVELKAFRSKYVYERNERIGFGTKESLDRLESRKIVPLAKWLMWEREINAYMVLGWCVIAPFCGVLPWLPHIWVTGPAGSGKSWVMDNFVKRLTGETAVVVQGKTTEAGLRGILQSDARPVAFDETDVDNTSDRERIQSVLSLARASSTPGSGRVSKGTQSGGSRQFEMRSCFAFSSIAVQLNHQSDRGRFSILGLLSFDGFRTKEEFAKFEADWHEIVTPEFVQGLQSRTRNMMPTILLNSKTFSNAVAYVIGNRRIGDQVGGMLAGAYSLSFDTVITYDEAIEWVKARDWDEERGLELTRDENRLFGKIMSHIVRVDGADFGSRERTIGDLIMIASGRKHDHMVPSEYAEARLNRLGIKIKDEHLWIANNSDPINNVLQNTGWSNNYHKILDRLPGAEKIDARRYNSGLTARGVSLPLDIMGSEVVTAPALPVVDEEIEEEPEPYVDPELPF